MSENTISADEAQVPTPATGASEAARRLMLVQPGSTRAVSDTRRPQQVNGDLSEMTEAVRETVRHGNGDAPSVFRTAGQLTRLGQDDDGFPVIKTYVFAGFSDWLASKTRWFKLVERQGEAEAAPVTCNPPASAVKAVLETADMLNAAPVLERISRVPFYTRERRLAAVEGYHASSRAWYTPEPGMVIPGVSETPTQNELQAAVKLLTEELLGDFPFETDADQAAAMALLLEPFVRDMIDGNTPLHLVEAPVQGTGKSKLAMVTMGVAYGEVPGTRLSVDDAENRKTLTSKLMEGRSVLFFDNVSHFVDSDVLAQALTQSMWSDRTLGVSKTVELRIRCSWVMTSNNAKYNRDFPRRISLCRLNLATVKSVSNEVAERPETRTGFRHDDLESWASEHRGELIAAVLTLVNSWLAAGGKSWSGKPLGSFENWSRVVGGILEHAGLTNFLGNREQIEASGDDGRDEELTFVETWWRMYADMPKANMDLVYPSSACGDFFGIEGKTDRGVSTSIGSQLGKMRDRVIGDFMIKKIGRNWQLTRRSVD